MKDCYLLCVNESCTFTFGIIYRIRKGVLYGNGDSYKLSSHGILTLEQLNRGFAAKFELFKNEKNIKIKCLCGEEIITDRIHLHNGFIADKFRCPHNIKKSTKVDKHFCI